MNKTPVYQFSFQYAYAHDECAQYNASLSANTACKEAIETAIGKHYADYRLDSDAAVREVVREFGYDRTVFVLASSIRRMDTDGRISQKNKEWARTIPIPETDERQIYYMVTRSHPGLLDIFTSTARHEYLLSLPPQTGGHQGGGVPHPGPAPRSGGAEQPQRDAFHGAGISGFLGAGQAEGP